MSTLGLQRDIGSDVALQSAGAEIPEDQLLDVWIELFDPGTLPKDKDDASGLSMDIRQAESRYMPVELSDAMEKTGYWGAVRVVPRDTEGGEVVVRGTILTSDGERLELVITAVDATGREWFSRTYESARVEAEAYPATGRAFPVGRPYDCQRAGQFSCQTAPREIITIRRVARLRFAADIVPGAYDGYLQHDDQCHFTVTQLPAGDDTMYRRVPAIRERDFLLIDTLNGHFDNFYREMQQPYSDWRRTRSEKAASLHEIGQDALKRKLLGVAAIVGSVAIEATGNGSRSASTGVLRDAMVLGGIYAIKTGFDKDSETGIHRDAITEPGDSFASETRPLVVEVEGQAHELTGSAEVQYAKSIYPRVKGIQVMNDMGDYMFSEYQGKWIPDSPARRGAIVKRLADWEPFSNSSPVEGIEAAIRRYHASDKRISLYVFGDDFSSGSIQAVIDSVDALNRTDAYGRRRVRVHTVGFPVQFLPGGIPSNAVRFAALMRKLAENNNGSFVGLNSTRP